MFDQIEMNRLVDLQQRSYSLLKWVAGAVKGGFVSFKTAHAYSTLPEAAEAWILGHYRNIPPDARPPREDLSSFCALFGTYLTNSFDLIGNPGKQRYSPDAHCFCPICSWFVDAPNLKTKKVRPADKRRAETMKANSLAGIAAEHRLAVAENEIAGLLDDPQNSEDACLLAYGHDLLLRAKGVANGPAVLCLWRGFAWTRSGSPKHGYRLRADSIVEAEQRLLTVIRNLRDRRIR